MVKLRFDATNVPPFRGYPSRDEVEKMTERERLNAAISFAEHEWLKDLDEREWVTDLCLACQLAAYDAFFFDSVMEWAKEKAETNSEELAVEVKALLFDALIQGRPSGHINAVRRRQHAKMRYIAEVLTQDYGYKRTRNEDTESKECAASIIERLGIPGQGGKAMSERSIERIIKNKEKNAQSEQ